MADVVRITLTPTAAGAKASATIVPTAAENEDPNLPPSPEPPMKEQELPEGSREYMAATLLLPALELAIDEMLRVCVGEVEAGQKPDPINFLATHLLRNNPHHDATAAARLSAHIKRRAAEDAAEAAAAARRKPPKPHLSDEDAAVRLEAVQRGHKARLVVQHKRTMAALPPPRLAPTKSGAAIALQAARRVRAGREKAEHRAAAARLAPPPLPWADPEGDSAVAIQSQIRGRLSRSKSSREAAVRPESAPAGGGADAVDPGPVAAEA